MPADDQVSAYGSTMTPQPLFEAESRSRCVCRSRPCWPRLRERDAVLQPGKRGHPVEVARHVRRLERQRPPDLPAARSKALPSGRTPTMVCGWLLRRTVRLTMSGRRRTG